MSMPPAIDEDSSYTQEGIMAQIWVAFGQGTNFSRVSQKAVMVLHARYFDHIQQSGIIPVWKEHAMQVLERIRLIGKCAAHSAVLRGDTTISANDVLEAVIKVQAESDTSWCPDIPRLS
jgi:hypothetical protein